MGFVSLREMLNLLETLTTSEIQTIIFAITILGILSYTLGQVFSLLRLPNVIGEILGGIILGPSVLGIIAPDLQQRLFFAFPEEGKIVFVFYWIGLILLMFISGFKTEISFEKKNRKLIIVLLVGSSLIPLIIGFIISPFFASYFINSTADLMSFKILFSIGIAITSIPVISKIFIDLNIIDTRFAGVALSSATIEDLIEWFILSVVMEVSTKDSTFQEVLLVLGLTIIAFIFSLYVLPKVMGKIEKENKYLEALPFLFCLLYVSCMSLFKINIIYSAMLAGFILKRTKISTVRVMIEEKIQPFALTFFIPVYFALVGIRIDIINDFNIIRFVLFFVLSSVIQMGSIILTFITLKVRKEAIWNFAIAMNARGGPGIVLASVGYEFGIINAEFFTTLILTSILTSLVSGWWLRIQTEKCEECFEKIYQTDK